MSLRQALAIACSLFAISLLMADTGKAVPFTSSFVEQAGTWNTIYAQGFSPSESNNVDPGVGLLDTVFLNRFDFFKSGNPDTAANFQLAIVSNIFTDLASLTTSSDAFVGLSTNTIASTAGIPTDGAITFNFDELPLTYGENYGAIFVNNNAGVLTPVLVSALTANYEENPLGSGMFLPIVNYGDPAPDFPGNFALATTNFTQTDEFGTFFFMFGGAGDARFVAYFNQEAVELPGDFNGDGAVDAADYVALRKLGDIETGYTAFFENFGTTAGDGATAVPEPHSLALLTLLGTAVYGTTRLRRRNEPPLKA